MLMALCSWPEVEAYLKRARGIIVPIGSIEQHGPMGLIGTDALTSHGIAEAVGERTGAMVAPAFNVGLAEHHMAFPGTITLRRSTMLAALTDWITSLARHGFEHIQFINGHGGNISAIKEAFGDIHGAPLMTTGQSPVPVRCDLRNWWAGHQVATLIKKLYGKDDGIHATASEVALTQHLYPQAIKHAVLEPRIAPIGKIRGPEDYRRQFPDGRIGSDSSLASPEAGAQILAAAVDDLSQAYLEFAGPDKR